jgi:FtsP/CotA-like multicopper oxidase with cupredoxin domain
MSHPNRRAVLGAFAGIGAAALLPAHSAVAANQARRLTVARRTLDVVGRPASVFGVVDEHGKPGVVFGSTERFSLELDNRTSEATSIHWHGQTPPPELDGISETGYVAPLAPNEVRPFDFAPRFGTHWMHSHHEMQEQSLMTAPLIVRSKADEEADLQEVVVLLNDFSFKEPAEIFAELTGGAPMDHGSMGSMDHGAMSMDTPMTAMGGMDLNDVTYDAFLANDRTLDDPVVVRTERGGRVRLRLINGSASTGFWIDLDGHQATAVAVDGNEVHEVQGNRFPLSQAQRLDLIVNVPAGELVPVFAIREGDRARTGVILAAPGATIAKLASEATNAAGPLDMAFESSLRARYGLEERPADARHSVMLTGSMSPYAWTLDDKIWGNRRKVEVSQGQRVQLEFMNHSMMAHPMHLHGHHFQVRAVNGQALQGAMRDTVLVPSMSTVTVEFDADNPGRWLYHCHNLYHMMTGMMSELVYV